jgi:hypothetical protein
MWEPDPGGGGSEAGARPRAQGYAAARVPFSRGGRAGAWPHGGTGAVS